MLTKDLQRFQQWSNMRNIDNRAKISENSDEFLRYLVKSLNIKFHENDIPWKGPWDAIIQNEKAQRAEK